MMCIPGNYIMSLFVLLLITILFLIASLLLNTNVLVLLADIGPYFDF